MDAIENGLNTLAIVEGQPKEKTVIRKPEKKCHHGKPPYRCVPCGGKTYVEKKCPHGKRKSRCPEESCGGTEKKIYVYKYVKKECVHGKTLGRCTTCGGNQICEHSKMRVLCVLCKGSQICEHKRKRLLCKDCRIEGTGGTSRCIHNNVRSQCYECKGSSICEHNKRREQCRECFDLGISGSNFCIHGTRKSNCKTCKGSSQVCEHGKLRLGCLECPLGEKIRINVCKVCVSKFLSGKAMLDRGLCSKCDEKLPRTEVTFGNMIIEQVGFEPNCKDKTLSTGAKCKGLDKRRPDLLWVIKNKVAVVVEIDEKSHVEYEPSCEIRKISEQNLAIQQLDDCENIPVYTIRVNPDTYDKKRITLQTRAETVAKKVREILDDDSHERQGYAKIFFYCYHSKADHIIEAQRKHWNVEILD